MRRMTKPINEVTNVPVQMTCEDGADLSRLTDDDVFARAAGERQARQRLRLLVLELRARGYSLAQIGKRLDADASTVKRWAEPAQPPGRRRRSTDG